MVNDGHVTNIHNVNNDRTKIDPQWLQAFQIPFNPPHPEAVLLRSTRFWVFLLAFKSVFAT